MSSSYLFGITKKYKGIRLCEYTNSWLFSPMIWEVLEDKYFKEDESGKKPRILALFGQSAWKDMNIIMNNSENTDERVCWELSNQQVFFTKDKELISNSIIHFIENHKNYGMKDEETGIICPLKKDHIIERFNKIASDIKTLDEKKYPYFVLKNTSCDDYVEYWFAYDKKKRRYKTLKDWDKLPSEFVKIEDNKITAFIPIEKGNF